MTKHRDLGPENRRLKAVGGVCVSLPGYMAARHGMFDSEAQKLVANLNVTLFTPCLSMAP